MSETSTSQDPVSYYIDHTIYTGRPADTTDRLPKEIRTYDLLDSLGITIPVQTMTHYPLWKHARK